MKTHRRIAPLLVILITLVFFSHTSIDNISSSTKELVYDNILRLHVIANSDSAKDQEIKLLVKEAVVNYMKTLTANCSNITEVKAAVSLHQTEIQALATKTLRSNNCNYPVNTSLAVTDFPKKTYGDLTFPAGEYEALKVKIGEARGKNWWCVLYPPLCFVDVSTGVVPDSSKEQLSSLIGEKAYQELLLARDTKTLKVKSKLWETIQELLNKKKKP